MGKARMDNHLPRRAHARRPPLTVQPAFDDACVWRLVFQLHRRVERRHEVGARLHCHERLQRDVPRAKKGWTGTHNFHVALESAWK